MASEVRPPRARAPTTRASCTGAGRGRGTWGEGEARYRSVVYTHLLLIYQAHTHTCTHHGSCIMAHTPTHSLYTS